MVSFKNSMGGWEVFLNEKQFGWISKEHGFFTDPTIIKYFISASEKDLRQIAEKIEDLKKRGYNAT